MKIITIILILAMSPVSAKSYFEQKARVHKQITRIEALSASEPALMDEILKLRYLLKLKPNKAVYSTQGIQVEVIR